MKLMWELKTYLKSELVTGYLSILKGCSSTSLVGDSPSFPSAALVPINIFPPGIFNISSAAGGQQDMLMLITFIFTLNK